jgi:hypothetical protein
LTVVAVGKGRRKRRRIVLEIGNRRLIGCRVLILEDEYFLANDLERALRAQGAKVIGPIAELSEAISQLDMTSSMQR